MPISAAGEWFAKTLHWLQASQDAKGNLGDGSFVRFSSEPQSVLSVGCELLAGLQSKPEALEVLLGEPTPEAKSIRERFRFLCRNFGAALQRVSLDAADSSESGLIDDVVLLASNLYRTIHPYSIDDGEGLFLQAIAWPRTDESLAELASLLVEYPPHDWTSTAMGISPLMRTQQWNPEAVFPSVLAALHHPSTVASILDLANYCVHSQMLAEHPIVRYLSESSSAESRQVELEESLTQMLGGVVARLGLMEEDPTKFGSSTERIQRVLNDAIALCVSLCDTIGLLKYVPAIGKLHQALELRHRRVQTEAAAALARMDQPYGRERLIALAAEPSARLRVLAYADELGIADQISPEYSTPQARAESELALWLSQPQQIGIPPHTIELLDHRTIFWPSFDAPQPCWLFRFQYQMVQGTWSNIGMAGPLLHAFGADLAELPIADIYAAFAGWQAEHSEIYEVPVADWNVAQRRAAEQFIKGLEDQDHDQVQPLWLGFFLGEICLVAESQVKGVSGVAVTDGLETIWYPTLGRQRPLGPIEAYSIFKGRKMLRTFNPDLHSDLEELDE